MLCILIFLSKFANRPSTNILFTWVANATVKIHGGNKLKSHVFVDLDYVACTALRIHQYLAYLKIFLKGYFSMVS